MKSKPRALLSIFLTLSLTTLCATVRAEWIEVQQFDDGMRVFVDKTSVQRADDTAQVRHLVRWAEPQEEEGIYPYLSTIVRTAYDCAGKRERYLGSASYAEAMGSGARVAIDDNEAERWYPISDASLEEKLWQIACER